MLGAALFARRSLGDRAVAHRPLEPRRRVMVDVTAHEVGTTGARSTVPARMDRLPWGKFHTRVVVALFISKQKTAYEITVAGAIADRLRDEGTVHFSASQVGLAASIYLLGE